MPPYAGVTVYHTANSSQFNKKLCALGEMWQNLIKTDWPRRCAETGLLSQQTNECVNKKKYDCINNYLMDHGYKVH